MMMWTIYDHPADYPDHFVVRPFVILANMAVPGKEAILCSSLEDARSRLPRGLLCVHRQQDDDPVIVESWL